MSGAGKSLITPQKGAKPRSKNWATHGSVTTQETAEALRKERNRLQAEKMLQPKEPLKTDVRSALPLVSATTLLCNGPFCLLAQLGVLRHRCRRRRPLGVQL